MTIALAAPYPMATADPPCLETPTGREADAPLNRARAMERYAAGDDAAFAELAPRLRAFLRRLPDSADAADDRGKSALVGSPAGLFSGAMMNLHCPSVDPAHVGFAHGIPVLIASTLGALLVVRWTRA